ncbi:Uncharacterised protein [Mycobacteroides abscessus subsp. abscessus]|nr:Uncharacterised protein [Mycobacteroides abscessus subsp. abscessus]
MEQLVGVVVDFVLRGRGESEEQRVEVPEDVPVLLVHRSVRLVDHDEIEVAGAESPGASVGFVDQPHHRGIGGDVDPPLGVLVGQQVHRRRVRQVCLERADGLLDQGLPVGEEQHPLDPVGAHQHVGERYHGARLARAGGHDEERSTLVLGLEPLGDGADRPLLVRPTGDLLGYGHLAERLPRRPTGDEELEFVTGVKTGDLPRRIAQVIPEVMFEPIAVVDDRPPAELLLEAIGIQLRLLLTGKRIDGCLLRLDDRQRQTVRAPQHVVDESVLAVGHSGDGELAVPFLVEHPAGLTEHEIDQVAPGLRLVVVVRVGGCGARLLRGVDLGAQLRDQLLVAGLLEFRRLGGLVAGLELCDEVLLLGFGLLELRVLGGQLGLELAELRDGLRHDRTTTRLGQPTGVELLLRRRLARRLGRVGAGQPRQNVEQLGERLVAGVLRHGLGVVDGCVAQSADEVHLRDECVADDPDELAVVDPGREVRLVRLGQVLRAIDPHDRVLHGAARVEAGGARVEQGVALGLLGLGIQLRPFGLQEVEVPHHGPRGPLRTRVRRAQ